MLAARLGVLVEDLPGILGIGRRTLFECRSADSAVSGKSWAKLALAEERAGIASSQHEAGAGLHESNGNPNDPKRVFPQDDKKTPSFRDDPAGYDPADGGKVAELERRLVNQELRMEALERLLAAAIDLSRLRNDKH